MRFLLFIFLICFSAEGFSQELFTRLSKNISQYYHQQGSGYHALDTIIAKLKQDPLAVDMVTKEVYQKNKPTETEVSRLLATFDLATGKWNDVVYNDPKKSGWGPKDHTERILLLTTLYTNPGSAFYQRKQIKNVLHRSLQFWFDAGLVSNNWWYNEIGIPKTLGPVFIMLQNELSPEQIKQAVAVLNKSTIKMTGQNKVWLAGNVLFKAILLKDESLAKLARDTIFSELKISGGEGIQVDYSFHQHGAQQQFGNYGLSFVNTLSFWARSFADTPLQIDNERLVILRDLMLNGFNWITWKGYLDINSFGRQFFKDIARSKALAVAYSMLDMTFVDPAYTNQYKAYISRNYIPPYKPQLNGTKHFWRSDMTVHRSPDWFATLKMSSDRVQATESINQENLKGYHIGDGSYFVQVDGDEYEGIFPYLNWKKLPGVTNFQTSEPLKVLDYYGYKNKGDFTGGVVSGPNGITAFQLNRDSLSGNKATFWLNDKMIALGSNINTNLKQPVTTTINQTKLAGPVYVYDKKIRTVEDTVHQSESIKWVYHNKIGYLNLQPSTISVSSKKQTGSWEDIAIVYKNEEPITKPVFTLNIDHHPSNQAGSYAYALVPGVGLEEFENFIPDFDVLQNSKQAQVVAAKDGQILMLAVYEALTVQTKHFPVLKFVSPGLYMIEKAKSGWLVSIADPTQKLTKANWQIGDREQSTDLPQGLNSGKTIQINIPFN
ncbi:MAG TPA: polysaccharide lyase 8 family protein [Pelobium sp.]|nr:polysaccharide lyase 8 family protein [Pelobium sp.]